MVQFQLNGINNKTDKLFDIVIGTDKVKSCNIFRNLYFPVDLLNMEVELQDLDITFLSGFITINIGSNKITKKFTVLNNSKVVTLNSNEEIKNVIYVYNLRCIGLELGTCERYLAKYSGSSKDHVSTLREHFNEVDSIFLTDNTINYFNCNVLQLLDTMRKNIVFVGKIEELFIPLITTINNGEDLLIKNLKTFTPFKTIYVGYQEELVYTVEQNIYKSFNGSDNNINVYNQGKTFLDNYKINMDKKSFNDNYWRTRSDKIINNYNDLKVELKNSSNDYNIKTIYDNSQTLVLNTINKEQLNAFEMTSEVFYDGKVHKVIGYNLATHYDSDILSGWLQLSI